MKRPASNPAAQTAAVLALIGVECSRQGHGLILSRGQAELLGQWIALTGLVDTENSTLVGQVRFTDQPAKKSFYPAQLKRP